jgi:hypothetical protein
MMARAEQFAREFEQERVGTEHVFLAMISDLGAIPTQVLSSVTDLGAVDARLRDLLRSEGYLTPGYLTPTTLMP